MSTLQIMLTEKDLDTLNELARRSGTTPEKLAHEAIKRLASETADETNMLGWREAVERFAGIWADRSDLTDFDHIRASLDRGFGTRE